MRDQEQGREAGREVDKVVHMCCNMIDDIWAVPGTALVDMEGG